MSNEQAGRLIAAVTLVLPNRKVAGRWMPGMIVKAGQTVPTSGLNQSHVDNYLKQGLAYYEGQVPQLKDVKALRPAETVNVSAKVKPDGHEDNPLDDGIDTVAGKDDSALESKLQDIAAERKNTPVTEDPALDGKLDEIEAKQSESGVEASDEETEPHNVEINAETGEVTETGGEPEFDEDEVDADAQVG